MNIPDVNVFDTYVSMRWRSWLCRFGWHAWSTWQINHVMQRPVQMFQIDKSTQQRRCKACGLYQEREL